MRQPVVLVALLAMAGSSANASIALLLEEPFGTFGGMNPTGHAAIYLSRVCADSPVLLRRCHAGEQGVVISRYHRVAGLDWVAIPVLPYLYAVDRADEVPASVNDEDVADLRDAWRHANLTAIVPDSPDGGPPAGEWIQLVGASYDRTIYSFEIQTAEQQDDAFIRRFNARPNHRHFNLFFYNCADFARKVIDFYYPHAVHRSLIADIGIMTPKQAARSLMAYRKRHPELRFSTFAIPQVAGTVPRSTRVRGVLESLVSSKRYAVPLIPLAALHPYFGGSLALAWIEGAKFDPRRIAENADSSQPDTIVSELQSNLAAIEAGE